MIFVSKVFIYRRLTVWPKAILKCRADLNFSVTVKYPSFLLIPVRFMIQFSGSLFLFLAVRVITTKSESAGFEKLKGICIMCISLWKQQSAIIMRIFYATEIVLVKFNDF